MARPTFDVPAARAAFTRYRILAWVTGTMLLILCAEMVLKYLIHAGGIQADGTPAPVLGTWVAMAHGVVYMLYLLTAVDLWSRVRWSLPRMAILVVAGVIPVLSFIVEHQAHRWFEADVAAVAEPVPVDSSTVRD